MMAISIHPYIVGAAHRTKYFRRIFETIRTKSDVLFGTGEQILDCISRSARRRVTSRKAAASAPSTSECAP